MSEAAMTETSTDTGYPTPSKWASSIALLAGLWLIASPWVFASPWMYGFDPLPGSWDNRVVGLVVVALAVIRLSTADLKRTQWISWINCVLAIWIFLSPWVFDYSANTQRLVNSVCVGVGLFVVAMFSALAAHRTNTHSYQPHRI